MQLHVHVNDELRLEAGTNEPVGSEQIIHAPKVTLFHQVLDYLRAKPDPQTASDVSLENEGAATAAVVLRCGSYFAVLGDNTKPLWANASAPGTSRISNSEMARINIEASAALAEWVDLAREKRDLYEKLVSRALKYLPLPKMRPTPAGSHFAILAMPEVAGKLVEATSPSQLARARADGESHPSRVFANALVNTAWRNGPVEDIHAGDVRGYPLDHRRMTTVEQQSVLGVAADRFATGIGVCRDLALERLGRSWPEQVLPYALASSLLITPTGWTLTEATREVRLPRS